jgi:transcriptional regulator with XRE-family HTH domain
MSPLQALRTSRGLTQETVVRAVQLKNRSAVAQWERGRSVPSFAVLPELARLYHVTVDTLLRVIKANDAYHQKAQRCPTNHTH